MDWSKAKTILIVAFLILNIILYSVIYINNKDLDPSLKDDFTLEVERKLREKNILLETEIPKSEGKLLPLLVEYKEFSLDELNSNFFRKEGIIEKNDNQAHIIYGKEKITLLNKRYLTYENKNSKEIYNKIDDDIIREIAYKFIEKIGINNLDMDISTIKKEGDSFFVLFSKKYKGVYLEKTYLKLLIDRTGVKKMDLLWLDVKDEGEKEIYIDRAQKLLLDLLDMEEVYNTSIEDIALCYYFDPEDHVFLETPERAKKGKTIPAWRVLLSNGSVVVLDNY